MIRAADRALRCSPGSTGENTPGGSGSKPPVFWAFLGEEGTTANALWRVIDVSFNKKYAGLLCRAPSAARLLRMMPDAVLGGPAFGRGISLGSKRPDSDPPRVVRPERLFIMDQELGQQSGKLRPKRRGDPHLCSTKPAVVPRLATPLVVNPIRNTSAGPGMNASFSLWPFCELRRINFSIQPSAFSPFYAASSRRAPKAGVNRCQNVPKSAMGSCSQPPVT